MKKPPLYPVYPIETLRDVVLESERRYTRKSALQSKKHGQFVSTTYQQLGQRVRELAAYLQAEGLKKGDRVGVLSENRTEWAIAYLGTVASGLVVVPVDKDLGVREIRHILQYSGASILFCSQPYAEMLEGQRPPSLRRIVTMEDQRGHSDLAFPEALEAGFEAINGGLRAVEDASVSPDDLAAVIFTSGTMGSSKAVMLTQRNIASNILSTSQMVSISNQDVLLSVLPLHHTYECTCGFLTALYQGATIYYAESLRRIAENLVECRATVMLGVPALFEAMYARIEKGIRDKGEGKFKLAKGVAGLLQATLGVNVRGRIFRQLHEKFGGRLRLLISGGAAINPSVSKGFRDLGINFIQGYGMTEASPLISVNREACLKDASVGLPIPGVEIRFDEGEILVRGPNVMKGYYLNDAATRETLDEQGWLRTGDLGRLDQDGFLFITGRKKSLIVTPNGKNVYPEELERLLNQSPFVLESLVWGGPETDPSKVEVQAIIVPDREAFEKEFGSGKYDEARVREVIAGEVRKCNQELPTFKKLKSFSLRPAEFEKTTTRKIKRYLYTGAQSVPVEHRD